MIGIYKESFIDYLKHSLNCDPKVTAKNIVCRCPFCEMDKQKTHFHLWIDLRTPIWNCFHAGCPGKSGSLTKLLKRIEGKDVTDQYVDRDKIKEYMKERVEFTRSSHTPLEVKLPELDVDKFKEKALYVSKRLKFVDIDQRLIKGLIFDVDKFVELNQLEDASLFKMQAYLQNNFIGFLTENKSKVIFRNIDATQDFKHFKLTIQENQFLDYYQIQGNKNIEDTIMLAEGVFDIYSEHLFDHLKMKHNVRLYASALSAKYGELIKSIVFHEQIFKPTVIILSDRDVGLRYYEKMKKEVGHLVDKLIIYYNKNGKDFNVTPVYPEKFII